MFKKNTAILLGSLAFSAISAHALIINEIRVDQPGNPDDEEFVEIKGTPEESLDGVWFLYVGDHSGSGATKGSGVVELALDLTGYSIPADGLFLMIGPNFDGAQFSLSGDDVDYIFQGFGNALENSDNVTAILVRGWSGNGGNEVLSQADQIGDTGVDIDSDDDGTPNEVLPWTDLLDAVGIFESPTSGEFSYGAALGYTDVGPDGTFSPSHIYRGGNDDVWQIGEYDVFELDSNQNVIGLNPEGFDTPGSVNPDSPAQTFEPTIATVSTIFAKAGDTIMVTGDNLDIVTTVTIGGIAATSTYSNSTLEVTVPEGAVSGPIVVTNSDGAATSVNHVAIIGSTELVLAEDFVGGLGDFSTYSVASTANWTPGTFRDSSSIEANGYGADVASDDWLISPAIDLSTVTDAYLMLGHERVFGGPALEVSISTDYDGFSAPSTATWTQLAITTAGDDAGTIVDSGKFDISSYDGESVYIGIRYTSAGTGPGEGAIDRIHYVAVGGSMTTTGWVFSTDLGWVYKFDASWGYSYTFGYINDSQFPWVYQISFGYLYHLAYIEGAAFWLYSPTLGYIYADEDSDGWFYSYELDGYDNFITPLD